MTRCVECEAGDHDNYIDTGDYVVVTDPETKELIVKGYVCSDHQEMHLNDGYVITIYNKDN